MGDIRKNSANASLYSIIAGFSLLYAVAVVYYYSVWLIPVEGGISSGYSNALNIAMCVCALVVIALIRFAYHRARLAVFVIGTLFFTAAIVTQAASMPVMTSASIISGLIGAGAGIGIGLLMPLWFEAIASLPGKQRVYACGIMSFGGMAIGMVIENLPHPFLEVVCFAMIVISTILYAKQVGLKRRSPSNEDRVKDTVLPNSTIKHSLSLDSKTASETTSIGALLGIFAIPLICAFSMSIIYGMIDATVMNATVKPSMTVFVSQFGGLAAGGIFLAYSKFSKAPADTAFVNAIFGVVATGLLLLPFLPEAYGIALNLVAATGWKLALLILFIFVVEYFAEHPRKLLPWITAAYALPRFGLLIGANLPMLFPVEEGYTFVRLAAIAFFLLYLILMTVWLINARARKAAERKAEELSKYREDPKRAIRAKAEKIAVARGLTKRETEVMMLLAEGRDLSFICNECYLSRNTVKSYTKSIYLKLEVHSKQELIDLVDNS